jgi:hypothetical protein
VTTLSTTTKPSTIWFRHFVEHPARIFKNKKKKKKDNKRLSQPNQAQFGSDILSNTRPASSRTKKRQQKQQKFNKTKPKE